MWKIKMKSLKIVILRKFDRKKLIFFLYLINIKDFFELEMQRTFLYISTHDIRSIYSYFLNYQKFLNT